MPIKPIVVVQAMKRTPRSSAVAINSGTPGMRFCFMTTCIIFVPRPQKWKRDSGRVSAPPLLRNPNMRRNQSLAELVAPFLRIVLSPQKVKKTVTCMPMAAAPVAIMKAAMARSKSPLRRTIVTRSGFDSRSSARAAVGSICAVVIGSPHVSECRQCPQNRSKKTIVSASFSCQEMRDSTRASRGTSSRDECLKRSRSCLTCCSPAVIVHSSLIIIHGLFQPIADRVILHEHRPHHRTQTDEECPPPGFLVSGHDEFVAGRRPHASTGDARATDSGLSRPPGTGGGDARYLPASRDAAVVRTFRWGARRVFLPRLAIRYGRPLPPHTGLDRRLAAPTGQDRHYLLSLPGSRRLRLGVSPGPATTVSTGAGSSAPSVAVRTLPHGPDLDDVGLHHRRRHRGPHGSGPRPLRASKFMVADESQHA